MDARLSLSFGAMLLSRDLLGENFHRLITNQMEGGGFKLGYPKVLFFLNLPRSLPSLKK